MKNHRQIFSLFFFLLIITVGCKKDSVDYRKKFLGDWKFKVEKSEYNNIDTTRYFHTDTLIYLGKIKYGSSEDAIIVEYSEVNSITLKVDKEGVLSNFPSNSSSGEFTGTDKIHMFLRWGGHGTGSTHIVDGEKK